MEDNRSGTSFFWGGAWPEDGKRMPQTTLNNKGVSAALVGKCFPTDSNGVQRRINACDQGVPLLLR